MRDSNYHAILIANSMFDEDPHNLPELKGPRNDPALLRQALCEEDIGLFPPENVTLVPERADGEIRREIARFLADASSKDTVLLYYSGHGLQDAHGQLYLCARNTRSDLVGATAVSSNWINEMIEDSAARVTIIVLDCCHSGAFKGGDSTQALSGRGRFVLASTRSAELAKDSDVRNGASLFTAALVDGLRRDAIDSDGDGMLSLDDLYGYVHRRLGSLGKHIPHKRFDGDGNPAIALRSVSSHPAAVSGRSEPGRPELYIDPLEIDLGDVEIGESLPAERVVVSNRGGGTLDWTAQASEPWVEVDADDDGLTLRVIPGLRMTRANVYVRERSTGEIRTIRIKVHVRESMPRARPAHTAPPLPTPAPSRSAAWYQAPPGPTGADATGPVRVTMIVISRRSGEWRDSLRAYSVLIDDRKVGSIRPGQRCEYDVTAGTHRVKLTIDSFSSPELVVDMRTGERVGLACGTRNPGRPQFSMSSAFKELKEHKERKDTYIKLEREDTSL